MIYDCSFLARAGKYGLFNIGRRSQLPARLELNVPDECGCGGVEQRGTHGHQGIVCGNRLRIGLFDESAGCVDSALGR